MLNRVFAHLMESGAPPPPFDPATLALTGWWRGSYVAPPWSGTASAGISGTNTFFSFGVPFGDPGVGVTVNGYDSVDFPGSNELLFADGDVDTYFDAGSFSGWTLVYIDAISSNSGIWFLNDTIIGSHSSARFGIYLKDDGAGTVLVGVNCFTGSGDTAVETAITTGAWHLVQWRCDGATLEIRVDDGSWASVASTGIDVLTFNMKVGSGAGDVYFNGKALDIGLTDIVLNDTQFDDVLSYARTRYALSL